MTEEDDEKRVRWLSDYVAGRVGVPAQRRLTREEADKALANLRMSLGLEPEDRQGRIELGLEE